MQKRIRVTIKLVAGILPRTINGRSLYFPYIRLACPRRGYIGSDNFDRFRQYHENSSHKTEPAVTLERLKPRLIMRDWLI